MKKTIVIAAAIAAVIGLSSCGGNAGSDNQQAQSQTGTKFAPRERESSMSAEERQAAIAAKKVELSIDPEVAFNSRGVKLTVLPPAPEGDITEAVATQIAQKMLLITTQNGVGGVGNVPNLVLGAKASQTGREATGTAPQKMLVKYNLTFQVLNLATGDVYATADQEVVGVGRSFEEAASNVAAEIKNTPALQRMLQTAEERILDYYNKNVQTVKNQVEEAVGQKNFDLALAMLHSVPEQAKEAFAYATKQLPVVLDKMKKSHAADELVAMQAAIAASDDDVINPEVAAHMQMIPSDCPEYAKAEALLTAYQNKVEARCKAIEEKAAADEAYARKMEEIERQRAHEAELAQIEADKVMAKYEAQASSKHAQEVLDASRGFWGNLGARIIDGIDFLGNAVSDS